MYVVGGLPRDRPPRSIHEHKRRIKLVVWWLGALTAAVIALVFSVAAMSEARRMQDLTSCELKALDFDNDSVETVSSDWWPPHVLCRYGYSYTQTAVVESHQRWSIYWPFVLVPASIAVAVAAARFTRRQHDAGPAPAANA